MPTLVCGFSLLHVCEASTSATEESFGYWGHSFQGDVGTSASYSFPYPPHAIRWTHLLCYVLVLKQWPISHGLKCTKLPGKKQPSSFMFPVWFISRICYGNEKPTNIIPCICIHVFILHCFTHYPLMIATVTRMYLSYLHLLGREPSCCVWNPLWPVSEKHSYQVTDWVWGVVRTQKEDTLPVALHGLSKLS